LGGVLDLVSRRAVSLERAEETLNKLKRKEKRVLEIWVLGSRGTLAITKSTGREELKSLQGGNEHSEEGGPSWSSEFATGSKNTRRGKVKDCNTETPGR